MSRGSLIATLCLVGCSASEGAQTTTTSAPIKQGAPSTTDPAVVAIATRALRCTSETPITFCTGTLIAPRVVLTAAHCLETRRVGELQVIFADDVTKTRTTLDVDEAVVHPQYDPSKQSFDVALLHLAKASAVKPIVLATTTLAPSFVGASTRIVGFGVDEAMASGVKKSGTAKVSTLGGAGSEELFRYVPGPAMSCGGDSGGPVFFDAGDGEKQVGITRSGDAACTELGTAVRIDAIASAFVLPYLAKSIGARPAFDRGVDECTTTCTSDAECPFAMVCLNEREKGKHCGVPGLSSGKLGARCANDAECGGATCVSIDDGCRCLTRCGSDVPPSVESSGCSLSARSRRSSASFALFWIVVALCVRRSSKSERPLFKF